MNTKNCIASLIKFCIGTVLLSCTSFVAANDEPPKGDTVLRIGFFYPSISQIADRTDILVSMNFWMQEISQNFDQPAAQVQLFDKIEVMQQAYASGNINMVVAPPMSLAIHFDRNSLTDCMIGRRDKDKLDSLLLISRTNIRASSLMGLKDKHLLTPDNDELAEIFLNLLTLKASNLPYTKFFGKVSRSKQARRMILDLFFDKADAALINQTTYDVMLELNPQIANKVKIMEIYPLVSRSYSFVHPDYAMRERLKSNYLKVAETARGRQLLTIYQHDALAFCDVHDLDKFDALYAEYQKLMQKVSTPQKRKH